MALRILIYKNKSDSDLVWQTQLIQQKIVADTIRIFNL